LHSIAEDILLIETDCHRQTAWQHSGQKKQKDAASESPTIVIKDEFWLPF